MNRLSRGRTGKEFDSPEALYARFRDIDFLRSRLANDVGYLRRQVGLLERIIHLLANTTDRFESQALLQASGLIHEPKAHASIEQMVDVGEQAYDLPGSEALARAQTPFPRPIAELADCGPVWNVADLQAWKAARREAWKRTPAGRSL